MFPLADGLRHEIAKRCAAFSRLPTRHDAGGLKSAAVTITLVETADGSGEAAFLLTRRAARLRAHGSQWALPGGRCDDGETAAEAGLRELDEELGLRLGPDQVLGLLDDYASRSGYLITPVVIWAGAHAPLTPNAAEVASVHRVALADIALPEVVDFITIAESDRPVVRVHVNGSIIHAPTAAVIYQFRELLAGRTTRVADLEQPVFAWR
jgi:8-oxo-dGTP pyrophosphatase MutT (NUDIX family)